MKTIERLFEATGAEIDSIAEWLGLLIERVAAIAEGRWTPSPHEREQVAASFGVPVAEASWGHSMNPRIIRYRRQGLRENLWRMKKVTQTQHFLFYQRSPGWGLGRRGMTPDQPRRRNANSRPGYYTN